MGLLPLEFSDCLIDSPFFRENLHSHEKELKQTSHDIKNLVKQIKDLLNAAKVLSRAQRNLASSLIEFKLECIENSQTEDENIIAGSLKEFGQLLMQIEDERDRMLEQSQSAFVDPLEKFRKEEIGAAKEAKKKFEKETSKFCQSQERNLNLSIKKNEATLQDADASLEKEKKHFYQTALEYVHLLQGVQQKKKFEFVETVLAFMLGWLTFYHVGHEAAKDFRPTMTDLQLRLQRTRDNFFSTHDEAKNLMNKMLQKSSSASILNKAFACQGYLYLQEKKSLVNSWVKQFCQYQKDKRRFIMSPYSQTQNGKVPGSESFTLKDCIRRMTDSIDKRFCFDVIALDGSVYTFQALSIEDRRQWLDAMDGKEPTYCQPGKLIGREMYQLNDAGFQFVRSCIRVIEEQAITDQGLYRQSGVESKVKQLLHLALITNKGSLNLAKLYDEQEYGLRTITSALKHYLRFLKEPLMTYKYHSSFISSVKLESKKDRIREISYLVHKLPAINLTMLKLLVQHLNNVVAHCDENLMTVGNLAVCLGPTLLRPEEESMAAILELKFGNLVVEHLIQDSSEIFKNEPIKSEQTIEAPPRSKAEKVKEPPVVEDQHRVTNGKPLPPKPEIRNKQNPGYVRQMVQSMSSPLHNDTKTLLSQNQVRPRSYAKPNLDSSPQISPIPTELAHLKVLTWCEEVAPDTGWTVKALYRCVGEHEHELSFEPNEILVNVKPSIEPGWLEGYHKDKYGLFPKNYVIILP